MKTKIFGFVAIVCIAFAASFVANKVLKSSSALSMVTAANVEALAQQSRDDYDTRHGEIYVMTTKLPENSGHDSNGCAASKSGKCFQMHAESGLFDVCKFSCKKTNNPENYCSKLHAFFANACQMF
jgi:hypothetical protein